MKQYKEFILQIYYTLTAHIPRQLPRSMDEFEKLKMVLNNYFDVPDAYECWATVAGHVMSVPSNKMRKSYADLSAPAKRLEVNKIAQLERQRCAKILEEAFAQQLARTVSNEPAAPDNSIN